MRNVSRLIPSRRIWLSFRSIQDGRPDSSRLPSLYLTWQIFIDVYRLLWIESSERGAVGLLSILSCIADSIVDYRDWWPLLQDLRQTLLKMKAVHCFAELPGQIKVKNILRFYERWAFKLHFVRCLCKSAFYVSCLGIGKFRYRNSQRSYEAV